MYIRSSLIVSFLSGLATGIAASCLTVYLLLPVAKPSTNNAVASRADGVTPQPTRAVDTQPVEQPTHDEQQEAKGIDWDKVAIGKPRTIDGSYDRRVDEGEVIKISSGRFYVGAILDDDTVVICPRKPRPRTRDIVPIAELRNTIESSMRSAPPTLDWSSALECSGVDAGQLVDNDEFNDSSLFLAHGTSEIANQVGLPTRIRKLIKIPTDVAIRSQAAE